MEEVVEAELALDKDAGEVEEVVREAVRKPSSYKSAEIQIDGHGGVLEAALQDTDNNNEGHGNDDVEDEDEVKFERRRGRVIYLEMSFEIGVKQDTMLPRVESTATAKDSAT